MSSRSERRRMEMANTPMELHSTNQRYLKTEHEGQKKLDHQLKLNIPKTSKLDVYDKEKDMRILERVARTLAGWDGADINVFSAEVRYLIKKGLLPSNS